MFFPSFEQDKFKVTFYQQEAGFVNLDDPLYAGTLMDGLRRKESRKKSKKKDNTEAEYSVIKEGVKEVDQGTIILYCQL